MPIGRSTDQWDPQALPLSETEAEAARDIFFVECRTGLRIGDLLMLRRNGFDGQTIRLQMQKTGRWFEIPVAQGVRVILEKYSARISSPESFIFPFIRAKKLSDEKFSRSKAVNYATSRINCHVKMLAQQAGISKKVTTHVGRHTFATMLLSKGASIFEVKEMLDQGGRAVTGT